MAKQQQLAWQANESIKRGIGEKWRRNGKSA